GITFHIVYNEQIRSFKYIIDKKLALQYLTELLSDYLNQKELQWLPFAAVSKIYVWSHKLTSNKIDENIKNNFQVQLQDAYSNDDSYITKLVKPEIPSNAFDRARKRFEIFFTFLNNSATKTQRHQ
ncbi:MAG: hypothetical protein ACNYWU_06035, partial [Desulfobacterales bacterium]